MELQIVVWLNHLGNGTLIDSLSYIISWAPFMAIIFIAIVGFLLWKLPNQRKAIIISVIVGLAMFWLINELTLKHLTVDLTGFRVRPYVGHSDIITPIGKHYSDSSFPSSHMAITLVMMTIMVWFLPVSRPLALLFVILMAFSRMHNGMHYPSDVLTGSILGIGYAFFGIWIAKILNHKRFR